MSRTVRVTGPALLSLGWSALGFVAAAAPEDAERPDRAAAGLVPAAAAPEAAAAPAAPTAWRFARERRCAAAAARRVRAARARVRAVALEGADADAATLEAAFFERVDRVEPRERMGAEVPVTGAGADDGLVAPF
jgi:hypothetical protein